MGDVILPAFSDEKREATIIAWYFDDGERIEEGDELLEIMVDELTYKIVADKAGVLSNLQYRAGDQVRFLEKLAEIEEDEE